MSGWAERSWSTLPDSVRLQLIRPLFHAVQGDSEAMEFRVPLGDPNSRILRILLNTVLDQARRKR
jgi:hypothetical protein